MKKYNSLGDLLQDYREYKNISQVDFANSLNIDTRTVQRWENNQTLIKPEKEGYIVQKTLLPHQLIRNLNAAIPIPTFYDFKIRKYSLTTLNKKLPEASWVKENIEDITDRIHTIKDEIEIEMILRSIKFHGHLQNQLSKELIQHSIFLLPELNLYITDDSGYYAGHSITFPINSSTLKKLRNKKISISDLKIKDLVNYKNQENPIFYNYDITVDCNDNFFYLSHHFLNFFLDFQTVDYSFCSFSLRHDSYLINKQFGLKLVWEDKEEQNEKGLETPPRLYIGDFKKFLLNK